MEMLKKLLKAFVQNLAGIMISTAIFISIFVKGYKFQIILLWQIIVISAVCAFGILIFFSKREFTKKQMRIRLIIHYLYINVVVLSGAYIFEWINPDYIIQSFAIMVLIAAVYLSVDIIDMMIGKRTAKIMNKQLNNINAEHETEEKK